MKKYVEIIYEENFRKMVELITAMTSLFLF